MSEAAVITLDCLWVFFSEICGRLPRPAVGGDGASRQRGASQCGGVSVRLQGRLGLRRPGDSGLRHEGDATESRRPPPCRKKQRRDTKAPSHPSSPLVK